MPSLPGMNHDVFFGPTNALPDWRKATPPADDDEPATDEERAAVADILGFDPAMIDEDDEEPDFSESESEDTFADDAGAEEVPASPFRWSEDWNDYITGG